MSKTILITGAGSGFGKGAAIALAARGHHVIATTETSEQASALAKEAPQLQVEKVDITNSADIAKISAWDIDVLINNAGFGINKAFTRSDLAKEEEVLKVLVRTPMRLMHVALPGMKERNSGVVINVSSIASFIAGGAYSASKAYLTVLSESLSTELSTTNIKVCALCPGFTRTEFHQRGRMKMAGLPNFMWLNSDFLVAKAWKDAIAGKPVSIPGWQYKLLVGVISLMPRSLVRRVGMNLRVKQR